MPRRDAPVSSGPLFGHPEPVTFRALDEDPAAYRDRLIRVTGALTSLPLPECGRARGPGTRWALVEEGLRLEGVGYERILSLVPEGLELTVDGFWRLYEGPLGCGKEPSTERIWYLEVVRLVQPNPLPLLDGRSLALDASPRISVTMSVSTLTVTPTPDGTRTPSSTPTPSPTPATTETPGPGTPSATPGASPTPTATPTTTPTATATGTPDEEEGTRGTPTVTPESSPTRTEGSTPTPPPPTNTPPSYPGGSDGTPPPATSTPSGGYP